MLYSGQYASSEYAGIAGSSEIPGLVFEIVSATESITAEISGALNASVFDAVSVSENVQLSFIAVDPIVDDVSMTESITMTVSLANISANDTVVMTEDIARLLYYYVSTSDTISPTESITTSSIRYSPNRYQKPLGELGYF